MRRIIWIVAAMVAVMVGCGREDGLRRAERVVTAQPDSALALLAHADSSTPRYALLKGYALMLRYPEQPLSDCAWDSVLRVFSTGADRDAARALLVRAYAAKHSDRPVEEMEYLKDAEFLARQQADTFNLALAYRGLASIFRRGGNTVLMEHYADRSAELFAHQNAPFQYLLSRVMSIEVLDIRGDFTAMTDSMQRMQPMVDNVAPEDYRKFYYDNLARGLDVTGRHIEAIDIWTANFDSTASAKTLAYWALALCRANRTDSARLLLRQARARSISDEETYTSVYTEKEMAAREGRTDTIRLAHSLDSLNRAIWEHRHAGTVTLVASVKEESEAQDAWANAERAREKTLIVLSIGLLLVLITVGIIIFYHKRIIILKTRHETDLLRIDSLQHDLSDCTRVNAEIAALFPSRFEMIDRLARSYFESKETAVEQKRLHAAVKEAIADFSSADYLAKVERTLDAHTSGLMATFRKEFPTLSKAQMRLALFLFCGFSLPSISIFTGIPMRNLYVYKSRLKSAVAKSDAPSKGRFLEYFG